MSQSLLAHLQHALIRITTVSPRVLASPPTQPRRASVALILRIHPAVEDEAWLQGKWQNGEVREDDAHFFPTMSQQDANGTLSTEARIRQFFSLPWVQRGTPELLFIKRAVRENDNWSSHVAFPGGRRDEGDESDLYTAMRETWEEMGIDLAEKEFLHVGHLEDREITSSLGKRLLMILSPHIFLQLSPFSQPPSLQPSEVAASYWVPVNLLFTPTPKWGTIEIDIARHTPQNSVIRALLRILIGKMAFRSILLPNMPTAVAEDIVDGAIQAASGLRSRTELVDKVATEEDATRLLTPSEQAYFAQNSSALQLWGLTLGMTLDLLAHMTTYQIQHPRVPMKQPSFVQELLEYAPSTWLMGRPASLELQRKAPSVLEVFPRFSYPDVNFWIWVLGWRYRVIQRGWERSIGTEMERRAHWSGLTLAAFYSAVRRALVVAITLRALGLVSLVTIGSWLGLRRLRSKHVIM